MSGCRCCGSPLNEHWSLAMTNDERDAWMTNDRVCTLTRGEVVERPDLELVGVFPAIKRTPQGYLVYRGNDLVWPELLSKPDARTLANRTERKFRRNDVRVLAVHTYYSEGTK